MSRCVHLHVCFPADHNDPVASLALKHLPLIPEEDYEARVFLQDMLARSGSLPGPRGGLSLWGMVGNHTDPAAFVEVLIPFWKELLSGVPGGPLDHENVVVFYEVEQSEAANAIQIGWDDEMSAERQLVVTKYENLPFCWRQS